MRHRFNDLPQAVRERLVKLTAAGGQADPRVLLSDVDWNGGWFKYFMAVGGAGVMAFCLQFLFERARDGIHPRHDEEVFLGLAAGTFVLVVAALSVVFRFVWKPPPYREGKWVFPSGLARLSGGYVEFLPMGQLGRPTLVTVRRNGSYSHSRLELGGPFTFSFTSNQTAEQATGTILAAKERMAQLLAARDTAAIAAVDPFAECTLSGTWLAPQLGNVEGPLAAIVPTAARVAQWVGGLFLGLGAAAGAFAFFSLAFPHH